MDSDLQNMSQEQLVAEVLKLRQAIRQHRDANEHDLCWHHPNLWSALPDKVQPQLLVPEWPQFLRGCVRYRESLDRQAPNAARTSNEYLKSADA